MAWHIVGGTWPISTTERMEEWGEVYCLKHVRSTLESLQPWKAPWGRSTELSMLSSGKTVETFLGLVQSWGRHLKGENGGQQQRQLWGGWGFKGWSGLHRNPCLKTTIMMMTDRNTFGGTQHLCPGTVLAEVKGTHL